MPEINDPIAVDRNPQTNVSREVKKELGKDDFLKILVTQLANQDPMSPMEDRDFIAQMAQFTSLEQLSNIAQLQQQNNHLQQFQAFQLIGKGVEGMMGKESINGIVTEVSIKDGVAVLKVGGKELNLTNVVRVYEIEKEPDPVDPEKPVDPEAPVDPEDPVDPEAPVDPEDPVDPESPVDPDDPVDPDGPGESDNSEEPEAPGESDNPVEP